jgi:nitrite reductase/ring-hydroxylating ferredoxin subunit
MDRRRFIHQGCLACAATLLAPVMLSSCGSMRVVAGTLEGEDLVLPQGSFLGNDGAALTQVVASHPKLKQPIAVFHTQQGYHAVLMRCTHKGVELRIVGERLECSAHGSLFDQRGAVLEGPASEPLRSFPVQERDGRIHISLSA